MNLLRTAAYFNCREVLFIRDSDEQPQWWQGLASLPGLPRVQFIDAFEATPHCNNEVIALENNLQQLPSHALQDFEWPAAFTLLLGHESHGLSTSLLSHAQHAVSIEMPGATRSLNVVSSCGIALHDATVTKPIHPRVNQQGESDVRRHSCSHLDRMLLELRANLRPGSAPANSRPLNVSSKLRGYTLNELRLKMKRRRMHRPQFGTLLEHGVMGDRNLAGVVRNAASFNASAVMYTGRRKFDRRAAVGAHNLVSTFHLSAEMLPALADQVVLVGAGAGSFSNEDSIDLDRLVSIARQSTKPVVIAFPEEGADLSLELRSLCRWQLRLLPAEFSSQQSTGGLPSSVSSAIVMRWLAA